MLPQHIPSAEDHDFSAWWSGVHLLLGELVIDRLVLRTRQLLRHLGLVVLEAVLGQRICRSQRGDPLSVQAVGHDDGHDRGCSRHDSRDVLRPDQLDLVDGADLDILRIVGHRLIRSGRLTPDQNIGLFRPDDLSRLERSAAGEYSGHYNSDSPTGGQNTRGVVGDNLLDRGPDDGKVHACFTPIADLFRFIARSSATSRDVAFTRTSRVSPLG
jgi:hypothetical protein